MAREVCSEKFFHEDTRVENMYAEKLMIEIFSEGDTEDAKKVYRERINTLLGNCPTKS